MAQAGATLIRRKKHLVYQLANGKRLVLSRSPSDPRRQTMNAISDLKKLM